MSFNIILNRARKLFLYKFTVILKEEACSYECCRLFPFVFWLSKSKFKASETYINAPVQSSFAQSDLDGDVFVFYLGQSVQRTYSVMAYAKYKLESIVLKSNYHIKELIKELSLFHKVVDKKVTILSLTENEFSYRLIQFRKLIRKIVILLCIFLFLRCIYVPVLYVQKNRLLHLYSYALDFVSMNNKSYMDYKEVMPGWACAVLKLYAGCSIYNDINLIKSSLEESVSRHNDKVYINIKKEILDKPVVDINAYIECLKEYYQFHYGHNLCEERGAKYDFEHSIIRYVDNVVEELIKKQKRFSSYSELEASIDIYELDDNLLEMIKKRALDLYLNNLKSTKDARKEELQLALNLKGLKGIVDEYKAYSNKISKIILDVDDKLKGGVHEAMLEEMVVLKDFSFRVLPVLEKVVLDVSNELDDNMSWFITTMSLLEQDYKILCSMNLGGGALEVKMVEAAIKIVHDKFEFKLEQKLFIADKILFNMVAKFPFNRKSIDELSFAEIEEYFLAPHMKEHVRQTIQALEKIRKYKFLYNDCKCHKYLRLYNAYQALSEIIANRNLIENIKPCPSKNIHVFEYKSKKSLYQYSNQKSIRVNVEMLKNNVDEVKASICGREFGCIEKYYYGYWAGLKFLIDLDSDKTKSYRVFKKLPVIIEGNRYFNFISAIDAYVDSIGDLCQKKE